MAISDLTNQRKISYIDAVREEKTRQSHIDRVVAGKIPEYVFSVEYGSQAVLDELRAKHRYTPPPGVYGATIAIEFDERGSTVPANPELIGKGIRSRIIIYADAYADVYTLSPNLKHQFPPPELYDDLDVIVENTILKNHFTQAQVFSQGFPKLETEEFRDLSGKLNVHLFNFSTQLYSMGSEYTTLFKYQRTKTSRFIPVYASRLRSFTLQLYTKLDSRQLGKDMDRTFIEELKRMLNPKNLFSI